MAPRYEHSTRAPGGRFSRRAALAVGGGGAAAAFLIACGGDDKKETTSGSQATSAAGTQAPAAGGAAPAGQPKTGGTLRYPMVGISSADPPTIYPFENLTYLAQIPGGYHYSRLLRSIADKDTAWDDQSKLEGDVAAKLPEQPDPLTFVFTLKPNIKFHDKPPMNGRAFTAKDVVATWGSSRLNLRMRAPSARLTRSRRRMRRRSGSP